MKRLNVLILENETVTCQSLVGILRNMGVDNIFVASNHTEAIELARKYRFHIMLSAVKIHDRYDGVDTVKALREFYSFAVIFICSYNDEKTLLKVYPIFRPKKKGRSRTWDQPESVQRRLSGW